MDAPPTLSLSLLLTMLIVMPGGCLPGEDTPTPPPPAAQLGPKLPPSFVVRSPAFGEGDSLPQTYTCDGQGLSPPLAWDAMPSGTESLALIVEDPDAPEGTAIHWVAWGIPASARGLPEGAKATGSVREGNGSFDVTGWVAPCPAPGSSHQYHFRLYALNAMPDLPACSTAVELHEAMFGRLLAESVLTGRYARPRQQGNQQRPRAP